MILARYTPQNIEVEITDVLDLGGGRKRVSIRALQGEPFTVYTMGGGMQTDSINVRPDQLTNVHQARRSALAGTAAGPRRGEGMQEYAAVFPVRFHTPEKVTRGGINND